MPSPFSPLRERLLRAGVSRRHAQRYLQELRDHLEDIEAEERLHGSCGDTSQTRARLGSDEALAEAMIGRREFRAWSAKAPFAVYLVAPSVFLVALTAAAMAGVVLTCTWLRQTAGGLGLPPWTTPLTRSVVLLSNVFTPVLLGWGLTAAAIRQRSRPVWPGLGLLALATVSSALQVDVTLPSAITHGEINLASPGGYPGRFVRDLILVLTPYACLSIWLAARGRLDGAYVGSNTSLGRHDEH